MSFDELLASVVRQAVAEAVRPLERELARLRQEAEKPVSVDEAAARLGVSRRTIERQIKAGKLPTTKIGSRTLVLVGAVLPSDETVTRVAFRARHE